MSDRKDDMSYQTGDYLKAELSRAELIWTDFIRDYQALARQSWEAMASQLQRRPGRDDFISAVFPPDTTSSVTLEHALSGLKSYAEWIQGAATSVTEPCADWSQQLEQLFGSGREPFSQAASGNDSVPAEVVQGVSSQWQAWATSLQNNLASMGPAPSPFFAFGADDEQQADQQQLRAAVNEQLEAANRYQRLMQGSNERALEKMRARLAPPDEPVAQIESIKALYDVWVECAEEAYAEIALSDEFRETYAKMVNTQMRVRYLQQARTEKLCRQMGMPTRSDMDNLGEQLHAFRRETRSASATVPPGQADEISRLRREVADLRTLIAGRDAAATLSKKRAAVPAAAVKSAKTSVAMKIVTKVDARSSKSFLVRKKASPSMRSGTAASPVGSSNKK